jgi:hypothetical protein
MWQKLTSRQHCLKRPHTTPQKSPTNRGQALAEFVILLIVLIILITGITTLAPICLKQEHLQRDARIQAGESALQRTTVGWVASSDTPETRTDTFHQINAITRLSDYDPALQSTLPMSHYTLEARDIPDGDLGLKETKLSQIYLLDHALIQLIHKKGTLTISTQLTFPATTGIWE